MSGNILVTGFGPFGDHNVNASWESVKLLPDIIDDFKIIKKEIPVSYVHVQDEIPKLWKQYEPQIVIHVGVSSFTNKLTIETCAHRDGYLKVDCMNLIQENACSADLGEKCLNTLLNVNEICNEVNKTNTVQAKSSENAGRYLCEFTYYTSLNLDTKKTLFIHVPPLDKPYSVDILAEGLKQVILVVIKQIKQ